MVYSSAAADVSLTGKNKMIDLNVIKIPWMSKATVHSPGWCSRGESGMLDFSAGPSETVRGEKSGL